MPYQVITSITVVTNGNTGRIIGKPDTFFFIYIDIIEIVSVHPVRTTIIGSYIGLTHTGIHIQFIYTSLEHVRSIKTTPESVLYRTDMFQWA